MDRIDLKKIKQKAGVVTYRENSDGEKEILLVSGRQFENSWVFPVGTVEENETPQITAARECEEESGYIVEVGEEVGTIKTHNGNHINYFTFFKAKVIGETENYEKDRKKIWVKPIELKNFLPRIFTPVLDSLETSL